MYAQVLNVLEHLVDFDLAGIHSAAPGEAWMLGAEKGDTRVFLENNWRYLPEIAPQEARAVSGSFVLDNEIFDGRRRDRLSVYREFLIPNRVRASLIRFWVMDGRMWVVALTRDRSSSVEVPLRRLRLVFPHLSAALRAATFFARDERADSLVAAGEASPAQERVISLVVRGLTNRETAALLGISPHTVRNTLSEVFRKLGVSRRSELAFLARRGICDGDLRAARHDLDRHRAAMNMFAAQDD